MLKRTLRQSLLILLVAGIHAPQSGAEEFSIVLDSGTRLTADLAPSLLGRRGLTDAFSNYSTADPAVVSGESAKDAADVKSFILMLGKPRTATYSDIAEGTPEGGNEVKRIPYKGVHVLQPLALWHLAAADAEPVLLGRAFTWSEASQLEDLPSDGPSRKFRIINRSTDEMIRMAIEEKLEEIPSLLVDAWSPSVIHQVPRLNVTPEKAWELLRQSVSSKTAAVPSSSLQVMTTYRPSRVVKNPDGGVIVEVDLWNRLPVRAYGEITCREARTAYPTGPATVEEVESIQQRNKARRYFVKYTFDLAAGQKDVARLAIPAEAGNDPQLFRDDEIRVNGNSSGLGTPGPEKPKPKGKRQKKNARD